MIASFRTWMFNKSLRGHQNYNKNGKHSGVNRCKSVCLISNGSSDTSRKATDRYKSKLESLNKTVDTLYFFDIKDEIEEGYSRQAIKWNGVPQHEAIESILSKEYDLLIFLNPKMEDHLRYLAILCNAKFKIGPGFEDYAHIFDLMIDSSDFSNTESLINNVDKQLKLLSA